MEPAPFVLAYYIFSAAAFMLLFLVIFWQRWRIFNLEKYIDDITLKFQHVAEAPKAIREEILTLCPFPVCVTDTKGKITFANAAFAKLTAEYKPATIGDFDKITGSDLNRLPLPTKYDHRLVTVRKGEASRQFNVIMWPVWGRGIAMGMVFTFHEQTHALRRKSQQLQFEQQLITYLGFLSAQIKETGKEGQAIHEEIRLLTTYLGQIHGRMRQPSPHESVDVAKICRDMLQNVRQELRRKQLHMVATFPKEAVAMVQRDDINLALQTILHAAVSQAGKNTLMRLDIQTAPRRIMIECTVPERELSERALEHAFAFGVHDARLSGGQRLWRLELAVVRELVSKYNGHLHIFSHKSTGTVYRITLVGEITK